MLSVGAFLIPYITCLLCGGIPLYFLEVGLGQYWQNGGITVWDMVCPLFKGIGYGTAIICCVLNIYYIVILAWALVYLFYSFNTILPWSTCNNTWNTEHCWTPKSIDESINNTSPDSSIRLKDSVIEFWENKILQVRIHLVSSFSLSIPDPFFLFLTSFVSIESS